MWQPARPIRTARHTHNTIRGYGSDGTTDEVVAEVEVDQVVEVLHATKHLHAVVGQGEKDERGKLDEAGAVQAVVVRTQPLEPGHVR